MAKKVKTCKFCGVSDANATPEQKQLIHFSYCEEHDKPMCKYCGICPKTPLNEMSREAGLERVTA